MNKTNSMSALYNMYANGQENSPQMPLRMSMNRGQLDTTMYSVNDEDH
jgi:hypothetical protein